MELKNYLNKIKWDKRLIQKEYTIYYLDRKLNKLKPLSFEKILRIDGNFIAVLFLKSIFRLMILLKFF